MFRTNCFRTENNGRFRKLFIKSLIVCTILSSAPLGGMKNVTFILHDVKKNVD